MQGRKPLDREHFSRSLVPTSFAATFPRVLRIEMREKFGEKHWNRLCGKCRRRIYTSSATVRSTLPRFLFLHFRQSFASVFLLPPSQSYLFLSFLLFIYFFPFFIALESRTFPGSRMYHLAIMHKIAFPLSLLRRSAFYLKFDPTLTGFFPVILSIEDIARGIFLLFNLKKLTPRNLLKPRLHSTIRAKSTLKKKIKHVFI